MGQDSVDGGTRNRGVSTDCARLFDVLGNACSRRILTAGRERWVSVDDLLEVCEASQTTIYRRVNDLIELNLIEESVRFTDDGQRQRTFRTSVTAISLSLGPNGFEARVSSSPDASAFDELLLDEATLDDLEITLSGRDVRFRVTANGRENHSPTDRR
ncbi:ArsR/SmtB family transcription factor [Natronorarus salvus]|uniref:ArsR/SmtB family transcription factor n=1 Tax=Natronorarus salvus TaxID=3117733 RepID=UPI002F26CD71